MVIAVAFLGQFLGGILSASISFIGIFGGPLLGLFSLGILTKRANHQGAHIGFIFGIMFTLTIFIGSLICVGDFGSKNICKTLFIVSKISFLWYALYGAITTFMVGYLTSFIFKPPLFYQIDGLVLGLKKKCFWI